MSEQESQPSERKDGMSSTDYQGMLEQAQSEPRFDADGVQIADKNDAVAAGHRTYKEQLSPEQQQLMDQVVAEDWDEALADQAALDKQTMPQWVKDLSEPDGGVSAARRRAKASEAGEVMPDNSAEIAESRLDVAKLVHNARGSVLVNTALGLSSAAKTAFREKAAVDGISRLLASGSGWQEFGDFVDLKTAPIDSAIATSIGDQRSRSFERLITQPARDGKIRMIYDYANHVSDGTSNELGQSYLGSGRRPGNRLTVGFDVDAGEAAAVTEAAASNPVAVRELIKGLVVDVGISEATWTGEDGSERVGPSYPTQVSEDYHIETYEASA